MNGDPSNARADNSITIAARPHLHDFLPFTYNRFVIGKVGPSRCREIALRDTVQLRAMFRSGSPSTVAPPDRLSPLVFGLFRLATEFGTSGFRLLASLAHAGAAQIALELDEAA